MPSSDKSPAVLIYVQHLLGSGHFVRAFHLARQLALNGLNVHLITGGFPVKHLMSQELPVNLQVSQLPAMRSRDADFNVFIDENGSLVDDDWKTNRCNQLIALVSEHKYLAAVIETFPFGRRVMRFELLPLLEMLTRKNPNIAVISSIRDILQKRKDKRHQETLQYLQQYFHSVLVHADPDFIRLQDSFPYADQISDKLVYTGYIYSPPENTNPENTNSSRLTKEQRKKQVIVSAGGSDQGFHVLKYAMLSKPLSDARHFNWLILYSPVLPENEVQSLKALAQNDPDIRLEPNRSDYTTLLMNSALSVSQAGYNTVLDVLYSGIASVLIPYNDGDESEQTDRASALDERGFAVCCDMKFSDTENEEATAKRLAKSVNRALSLNSANKTLPDTDGISASAKYINQIIENKF